jgi:hypothetical protein
MKFYTAPDKPSYPNFVKKTHNWAAQARENYYKSYAVYEFPDDKMKEAMLAIMKRYNFYAQMEGYAFEVELLSPVEEMISNLMGK